jgi:subtilisin family serine protease
VGFYPFVKPSALGSNATGERAAHRGAGFPRDRMKKLLRKWGMALLALGLATHAFAAAPVPATPARVRGDRILVRPKEGGDLAALGRVHGQLNLRLARTLLHVHGLQVLELPPMASDRAVAAIIAALNRTGLVDYAERDYDLGIQAVPNDFRYYNGDQWNMNNIGLYGGTVGADIHATTAWDVRTDGSSVIVAIPDTGIRYTHEDLVPNLWTNPGEMGVDALGRDKATNGVDDDGDGWIDDVFGINTLNGTGDPWDDFGHGSHVAGIIGGRGNNSVGVAGINWKAKIMALKFIDSAGHASVSDAVTAIDYARGHGAKVVNASWGNYSFTSQALRDAVNALNEAGIIFVAAAGNSSGDNDANPLWPASYEYPNVISVAATDRTDARPAFSNYGRVTVDLAAPGTPVFSCWNGSDSDYRNWDGTSMAAPHVTGAVALLRAQFPNETPAQIVARILNNTDPLPSYAGLTVTGGRLNLAKAITAGTSGGSNPPPSGTPPGVVWFNDDIPAGAWTMSSGGDAWNWITSNPTPFAGFRAHQTNLAAGYHDHTFTDASATMTAAVGEIIYAYIYVDPTNPPAEIMLSWNAGNWEHRAYWGADLINYGTNGTASRRFVGPIPQGGQWVRLEVPAAQVGLEGVAIKGMSFSLMGGKATWDAVGRKAP